MENKTAKLTLKEAGSIGGRISAIKRRKESLEGYMKNPKKCLFCGLEIIPKEGQKVSEVKRKKFCGQSCSAQRSNQKRKIERFCIKCGKILHTGKVYCSRKCQRQKDYESYVTSWKNGEQDGLIKNDKMSRHLRKYLLKKNNFSCQKCGWNKINQFIKKCPVEIHHIDGNFRNNKEENLEILCPNCHSLTQTFRNNNGHGRPDRRKKMPLKHKK